MVGGLAPYFQIRLMHTQLGSQNRKRQTILIFIEGFKNSELGAKIDQMGGNKALFKIADFGHLGLCADLLHNRPPCIYKFYD